MEIIIRKIMNKNVKIENIILISFNIFILLLNDSLKVVTSILNNSNILLITYMMQLPSPTPISMKGEVFELIIVAFIS